LDRALDEGGINYGNRRVLGLMLEPIPGPTALMLFALQGRGEHPRVVAAVRYLLEQALTNDDVEHLCWARLALDLYRDHPGVADQLGTVEQRILAARKAREQTPWLRPALLREALTILAFGTQQGNPFRLPATDDGGEEVPEAPPTQRRPLLT